MAIEREFLPYQPSWRAADALSDYLGVGKRKNLYPTEVIRTTSEVYGDEVLIRWGKRPQGKLGYKSVALDARYSKNDQDESVYEVRYSQTKGWEIPMGRFVNFKDEREGLIFGPASISEVALYVLPNFEDRKEDVLKKLSNFRKFEVAAGIDNLFIQRGLSIPFENAIKSVASKFEVSKSCGEGILKDDYMEKWYFGGIHGIQITLNDRGIPSWYYLDRKEKGNEVWIYTSKLDVIVKYAADRLAKYFQEKK